jgi:hypothetical protein
LFKQEDWVLCRVFYKKKADTEYAMDREQELIGGGAAVKGYDYASSSSCQDPEYHSPPASFPSLGVGGHHYQLPPSSHDHHRLSIDAFSSMPPLLSYDSILDFSQHLDSSGTATGSRDGTGDPCSGVLMDLGLQEEQYNYNSLM